MGLLIVAEAPPAPASALIAIIAFQTGEAPLEVEVASVVAVAAEDQVLMVLMMAVCPRTIKVPLKEMWEVTEATSQVHLKNHTTTAASMGPCKASMGRRQTAVGSMKDMEILKVRSRVN